MKPGQKDVLLALQEAGVINEDQYAAAELVLKDRNRQPDGARDHPGRRSTDRLPRWLVLLWQNVVPLVALGLAAIAVAGTQSDVDVQRQGRKVAIDVLCGFGNGVEAAGKKTIAGGPIGPPEFRRNLEKLGLPPESVRKAGAQASGEAYARSISQSVAEQAGAAAKDVVNKDGSLNCDALRAAAKAGSSP